MDALILQRALFLVFLGLCCLYVWYRNVSLPIVVRCLVGFRCWWGSPSQQSVVWCNIFIICHFVLAWNTFTQLHRMSLWDMCAVCMLTMLEALYEKVIIILMLLCRQWYCTSPFWRSYWIYEKCQPRSFTGILLSVSDRKFRDIHWCCGAEVLTNCLWR